MGEIPEGVRKEAERVLRIVLMGTHDDPLDVICGAILAERQRCADIALSMKGRTNIDEEHNAACDDIADAILNPPT